MDDRESDIQYLRQVELKAREVVEAASQEGWLSFLSDEDASPVRRAVNELARNIRYTHGRTDDCSAEWLPDS